MNTPASTLPGPAPERRSALVSVLGWLAIACGALTVLATINQPSLYGVMAETPIEGMDPAVQEGLVRFGRGITALNLAIAGFVMYAGYALWKRRNWARVTFIALFALGIAVNLIWAAFAVLMGPLFAQVGAAFGAVFVLGLIMTLAMAALFYWFIRRLRSPAVKSEFV